MTIQRHRGQKVEVYSTIEVTDFRGQTVSTADMDNPFEMTAWIVPDRSSRAEVPGQQDITVYQMGVDYPLSSGVPPIDLWSRVKWDGAYWDVATPPSRRFGTRHVRHQTLTLRRRTIRES